MSFTTADLQAWIAEQTGLHPDLLNQPWFESLMNQRLAQHGLQPTAHDYRQLLQEDAEEMQRVMRQVAVPETWFFRYRAAYDYLADYLRQLRQTSNRGSLRMLSIACATGEEPFSMAITAAYAQWPVEQIHIDALDWDQQCLLDAQQLNFSHRAVREELPGWASPWMEMRNDQLMIDQKLSRQITWRHANVLASPSAISLADYQVVFCRNLLVYLNPQARQELISRLGRWLANDGRLFVGHADAHALVREEFDAIPNPNTFAFCHAKHGKPVRPKMDQHAGHSPAPRFQSPSAAQTTARRTTPLTSDTIAAVVHTSHPAPDGPAVASSIKAQLETATQLADKGNLQDALSLLNTICENHDPEIFALQGSILLALDRVNEAKQALRRALYLDPMHAETLLQLAMLHARSGDHDLAKRYRQRAADATNKTNNPSGYQDRP